MDESAAAEGNADFVPDFDNEECIRYLEQLFGNESNLADPAVPPSPNPPSPKPQELSALQAAPEPSVSLGEPMPSIAEEPDQSCPVSDPTPSSMPDLLDVASPPRATNGTAGPEESMDQSNAGRETSPPLESATPKNRPLKRNGVLVVDSELRRKRVQPTNNKVFTCRPKLRQEWPEVNRTRALLLF